jgi:biofilm PGA synthesis N-glycosyltransferase PgaC
VTWHRETPTPVAPAVGGLPRHVARPRSVALLPAHNEEDNLAAAVGSLVQQSEPPDAIMVVADNCTDSTPELAQRLGTDVFVTQDNAHKKAGGLNQALTWLIPQLRDDDLILVMDADSRLDSGFLEGARLRLTHDPELGGVGGTFAGGPGGGLLGTFQRNEYARYARDVRRLKGKALVLTGTASVFPVRVLREVKAARQANRLPDQSGAGDIYDIHVLTEDNELSLALMHLGYRILAPRECTLETEVMTTWGDLARQRSRWKRGALENIVDYGFTRVTAPYWGRQLFSLLGLLATSLYLGSLVYGLSVGMTLHPIWIAASLVFALERMVTVRARGWRQILLAAPLVIEMLYDLFLQAVQLQAFKQVALNTEKRW